MGIVNEGRIAMDYTIQKCDIRVVRKAKEIWFPRPKVNKEYEKKFNRVCEKKFKFIYNTLERHKRLYDLLDCKKYEKYACQPSTGVAIIDMIIDIYGLKGNEVNVFGFDNFKTVHYFEKRKRTESIKYHNGRSEASYIKSISQNNNNFKVW